MTENLMHADHAIMKQSAQENDRLVRRMSNQVRHHAAGGGQHRNAGRAIQP